MLYLRRALINSSFDSPFDEPLEPTEAETETLSKKRQVVRIRVYNVVKHWVDKQWVDFIEDSSLVEKMLAFTEILNDILETKA